MNRRILNDSPSDAKERFPLEPAAFTKITTLIEKRTGLIFPAEKRRELAIKLDKLDESVGVHSIEELIDLMASSEEVLQKTINVLTVGESYFFRNRPHFTALKTVIFPQLICDAESRHRLRIWCAGCARGEEPYSIAILIKECFPEIAQWDVSIVATDINTEFLTSARQGIFRKWSFRGVEDAILKRYFETDGSDRFRIREDLRSAVVFKHFNLAELLNGARPFSDNLDLLLCRNVLIYFPFGTANSITDSLQGMIRPGGYLVVGHAEAFPALGNFEVIYSSATYFYRRYTNEHTALLSMPAMATASIPGIAVRSTYLPPLHGIDGWVVADREGAAESPETPPDLDDQMDRAREMANSDNTAGALALLDELSKKEGILDYRVYFLSAVIADHMGNALRAINSLKHAIFLNKSFVIGHYFLGVIYQREGDKGIANRHFNNTINLLKKLSPDVLLEEGEGMSARRLLEITMGLCDEMRDEAP